MPFAIEISRWSGLLLQAAVDKSNEFITIQHVRGDCDQEPQDKLCYSGHERFCRAVIFFSVSTRCQQTCFTAHNNAGGVRSLRTMRSIDVTATVRSMEAEQIMPPETATHVVDLTITYEANCRLHCLRAHGSVQRMRSEPTNMSPPSVGTNQVHRAVSSSNRNDFSGGTDKSGNVR